MKLSRAPTCVINSKQAGGALKFQAYWLTVISKLQDQGKTISYSHVPHDVKTISYSHVPHDVKTIAYSHVSREVKTIADSHVPRDVKMRLLHVAPGSTWSQGPGKGHRCL